MSLPVATQRVQLVEFGEEHLTDRYVEWLNDPEVVRFSEQRFQRHTPESCRTYWEAGPDMLLAILANRDVPYIGTMSVRIDHHGVADLGIMIGDRDAWGRGFGTEAWMLLSDMLLGEKGIRKVTAGALAVNEPMLKVMRNSGMVEDGRRVRQALWTGQEVDIVHYARFA